MMLVFVVCLLLIVLALFVWLIPYIINGNDYKTDIIQGMALITDYEFQIHGHIRVNVLPWFGLKVHQLTLGNRDTFNGLPLAQVDFGCIVIRFLPYLKHNLVIKTILLHTFEIHLVQNAKGEWNWQYKKPSPVVIQDAETSSGNVTLEQVEFKTVTLFLHPSMSKTRSIFEVSNVRFQIQIDAKKQIIHLEPVRLFQGMFEIVFDTLFEKDIAYDLIHVKINKMDLSVLIQQVFHEFSITNGTIDVSIDVKGNNLYKKMDTCIGNGRVFISNAILHGYTIPNLIEILDYPIREVLMHLRIYKEDPKHIHIHSFSIEATLNYPTLSIDKLFLITDMDEIIGHGEIDLVHQTIQGALRLNYHALAQIPFAIKGDLLSPTISLDVAGIVLNSIDLGKEIMKEATGVGLKVIEKPIDIGFDLLKNTFDLFGVELNGTKNIHKSIEKIKKTALQRRKNE
ncbi:MAG: AsmA family protein [Desulfobacterales bacterium]|nr:AsmA family protein [Desulfobacterales bacterium]